MISGLIHLARPAEPEAVGRLADTLSSLVSGVAAGLVADAVIVSGAPCDAVGTIADEAGATLVLRSRGVSPWLVGARAARQEWLLCLEAGDIPREGWIRILDRFVETVRPEVGLARLRRPHAALPSRLAARGEGVVGARQPRAGDLVRRSRLVTAGSLTPRLKPRILTARLDRS